MCSYGYARKERVLVILADIGIDLSLSWNLTAVKVGTRRGGYESEVPRVLVADRRGSFFAANIAIVGMVNFGKWKSDTNPGKNTNDFIVKSFPGHNLKSHIELKINFTITVNKISNNNTYFTVKNCYIPIYVLIIHMA